MQKALEFPALLPFIDERGLAFGAAVRSAPSLQLPVPTCPGWTLLDLVEHLGNGHRKWAAAVDAGPAADRPGEFAPSGLEPAPRKRAALLAWWAESVDRLLSALRAAGPDRGCWTWWGDSQSPPTAGAVARHRVQEAALHTYDAQLTVGAAQPLPDEVALDGVDEFLSTCVATTTAWPHPPVILDFHATEGRSWRLFLSAGGARSITAVEGPDVAAGSLRGTAGELVLIFYDRIPIDARHLRGDGRQFDLLRAWVPSE